MSTRSRNSEYGKVLRSVQIGAGSKCPDSILDTRFAQAKASISLKATVRRLGIARLSPRSMPPYPAQRLTCVTALGVSTSVEGRIAVVYREAGNGILHLLDQLIECVLAILHGAVLNDIVLSLDQGGGSHIERTLQGVTLLRRDEWVDA